MSAMEREWIATRQLARELGVSVDVALSWQRMRSFPAQGRRKSGKHIFWHLPTVKDWCEHNIRRRRFIYEIIKRADARC